MPRFATSGCDHLVEKGFVFVLMPSLEECFFNLPVQGELRRQLRHSQRHGRQDPEVRQPEDQAEEREQRRDAVPLLSELLRRLQDLRRRQQRKEPRLRGIRRQRIR